MKKIQTIVLLMFLTLAVNFANAQSNNQAALIGKAKGAAHTCLSNAHEAGFEFKGQVETAGICYVSGFITKVTFYKVPKCHQEPCPRPIAVPVAEVTFGCNGEVINVSCL